MELQLNLDTLDGVATFAVNLASQFPSVSTCKAGREEEEHFLFIALEMDTWWDTDCVGVPFASSAAPGPDE